MVVRFRPVGDAPQEQAEPARENLAEIVEFRSRLIKRTDEAAAARTAETAAATAEEDAPRQVSLSRMSGNVIPLMRASDLLAQQESPTAQSSPAPEAPSADAELDAPANSGPATSDGWGAVTTQETWETPEFLPDAPSGEGSNATPRGPRYSRGSDATDSASTERPLGDPREQGLKKLARRAQTVRELERYLRGLGHEEDAVQTVVSDFLDHGYLNDADLARVQCAHLRERKRASNQVITRTLSDRGVDRALIQQALAELDPEGESEDAVLRQAAYDRARRLGSLDRVTAERRLLGFLARRGWGGGAARDIARAALDEAGI